MRWPPPFTTTSKAARRGLTLLELIISSSLFLLVSTALLSLFHQSRLATDKAIDNTDLTSTMMVVFEKIRGELRGVRVLGITEDARLEYWKVRTVDGLPQLTALGRPDYLPGSPADPDSAFLSARSDLVISEFQGQTRRLARLVPNSQLGFAWHAASHILTVSGRLGDGAAANDFYYRIYVSNNE